jgi:N-acetylglucosaminyldiphosphoundecaprenol N-acetyl-beta-D-mannosaminyltransferase
MENNLNLPSLSRPPIAILGVPFDNITKAEAIERIECMIASREPHYLVTPNVDFLVQARNDVELRRILFEAHLVLCDGTPLVWASRLLGNPLPERVAGADVVPLLISVAERMGYRLFLLGATPESAQRAIDKLRTAYPKLLIAGSYSPPFKTLLDMDHDEIKRRICEAEPDLLLVSFGCPKQEKWIAMHYRDLGVSVTAGVGATIDFLAGQVKRAPVWMQRSGTEWVFRLIQEPRRLFKRYAKDLWIFGTSFLLQYWQLKSRSVRPKRVGGVPAGDFRSAEIPERTPCSRTIENTCQHIRPPNRLDATAVATHGPPLERGIDEAERHWLLEMNSVTFIDSTGVGFLIRLHKRIQAAGRHLVLVNPSPNVKRALAIMRLDDFFLTATSLEIAWELLEARIGERSETVTPILTVRGNTLAWQGEITAANAAQVWKRTFEWLESHYRAHTCTIDLAAVRFIDSTGLGLMVRIRKLAQQRQRTVSFINLRPAVRNVLRIARLEQFLLESEHRAAERVEASEPEGVDASCPKMTNGGVTPVTGAAH